MVAVLNLAVENSSDFSELGVLDIFYKLDKLLVNTGSL
jgi:hypothetical protein